MFFCVSFVRRRHSLVVHHSVRIVERTSCIAARTRSRTLSAPTFNRRDTSRWHTYRHRCAVVGHSRHEPSQHWQTLSPVRRFQSNLRVSHSLPLFFRKILLSKKKNLDETVVGGGTLGLQMQKQVVLYSTLAFTLHITPRSLFFFTTWFTVFQFSALMLQR